MLISQPCHLTHALHSCNVMGDISRMQPITCEACADHSILPKTLHHKLLQKAFEQLANSNFVNVRSEIGSLCIGYFVVRMSYMQKKSSMKSELKKTYKIARKLAKTFLINNLVDFVLWSKLAKVESLAENYDECKKITFNALAMCKNQSDALLLCRSFVELAFDKTVNR